MRRIIALVVFICVCSGVVIAQKQISGKVTDGTTGEGLAAAHVIIKGTYIGTIANEDGEFSLVVKNFPATIVARFIGFETEEIAIDEQFSGSLNFVLKEAVVQMNELTVTGEDPAISIMKEVIRRKKIWRANLKTYKVDAYSRQQLLNDTTIVSISETISEAFWDSEKGPREVLKSKRQTANIEGADNFAGVSYLPNFYNDHMDVAGFDVVGITNERALKYYNFKLVDYKSIDDKVVYEIEVSPRKPFQPLFEGTIYVVDEDFALLSVKLKPNQVVVFPPPVQDFNLAYEQQFSNFGGDYWLPVDVRIEGLVEVGVVGLRFPPIGFKQVSKLNNYQVNVELPDSLYKVGNWMSVDSTTIGQADSLFENTADAVPLSNKETTAYTELDSTATLEKAFKPKGFLTRFLDLDEDDGESSSVTISSDGGGSKKSNNSTRASNKPPNALQKFAHKLTPIGRYNKVDAIHLGLKHTNNYAKNRLRSEVKLGYSLGNEDWAHGFRLAWWPLKKSRRLVTSFGYNFDTSPSYQSDIYGIVLPSVMPILGYDDYYNYFRKEGAFLNFGYIPKKSRTTYRLNYTYENHRSIDFKTSYDILGRDNVQPLNPLIEDGRLSALELSLSRGDRKNTYGTIEQNGLEMSVEQSAKLIGSDWNYTRFKLDVYKRFTTFYKKRFLPNVLDIRVNAGTYLGDLPVQENGVLDASFGYFTPFGAFKTKRYIPYQGASYAGVYAEHNFRSVPLEMLGWRSAPKTGLSIIAFGGIGKTWNPEDKVSRFNVQGTDDVHIEVGGSLSNIFSLFRVDFAFRLDDPGFYPGVSVARFF